jgi:hypothetical protein
MLYYNVTERCFRMEASGVHRQEALTRQAVCHASPLAYVVGPHGFLKEASTCRIEALLDVRFYHPGVSSELELDGQCLHRLQGAYLWAIAIPIAQEILRIAGFEEARYCPLQELVFSGGNPQGTLRAIPFRNIRASDELGAVPLLLQALHEVVDVFVQVLLVFLGTHLIHASGGILSDVAPALLQEVLIEPPVEVAEPISLLTGCLLG